MATNSAGTTTLPVRGCALHADAHRRRGDRGNVAQVALDVQTEGDGTVSCNGDPCRDGFPRQHGHAEGHAWREERAPLRTTANPRASRRAAPHDEGSAAGTAHFRRTDAKLTVNAVGRGSVNGNPRPAAATGASSPMGTDIALAATYHRPRRMGSRVGRDRVPCGHVRLPARGRYHGDGHVHAQASAADRRRGRRRHRAVYVQRWGVRGRISIRERRHAQGRAR